MGDEGVRLSVIERLIERGCEFDFFQAVWLLERMPEAGTPVGGRGPVSAESICFRPAVSMGFPSTDVRHIRRVDADDSETPHYRVEVRFLGLYGVDTPLPLHYAVDVLRGVERTGQMPLHERFAEAGRPPEALDDDDSTPARDFLDLLHHRVISLFYRTWTKYRYDVAFGMPGRDVITDYLLRLVGCAPDWDEPLLGVSPARLLRYAGVLTQQPRSAVTLEGVLADYWDGIPIRLSQFVGRWVALKQPRNTLPGEPPNFGDLNRIGLGNSRLGVDLTVGEQVYDLSGKFKLVIGPMDWPTYETFLPDGYRYAATRSLTRLYTRDPLAFEMEVLLRPGEVPELCLSSDGDAGRLGYSSWVRTDELPETSVTFDVAL